MALIDPSTPAGVQPHIPGASGYTLAFSDEFSSSTIDPKWVIQYDFANGGFPSNWDVNAGGNSKLRIWPNAPTNYNNWTMRSLGSPRFSTFTYGVWEASVKLCRGRGIFPAFWAYKDPDANPQCEIDIFEAYGYDGGGWNDGSANGWRPTNAAWTIWRDGGGPPTAQAGTAKLSDVGLGGGADLSAAQHIYTLLWEPSGLTFFFDGVQWGSKSGPTWSFSEINGVYGPCCVVFDLWFRLAGLPEPDSSNTPSGPSNSMEVDYVRVWNLVGVITSVSSTPATIYLQADPTISYSAMDATGLQTMGTQIPLSAIPVTGYPGNVTDGLINFQHTADPADFSQKAFLYKVAQRDTPGSTGGKRTELSWSPGTWPFKIGSTYWTALRFRLPPNLKLTTATDEVLIWQLQHNLAAGGLNPNMAIIATGGTATAAELFVRVNYATTATPSLAANMTGRTVYTLSNYPVDTWMTFVLNFKLHHTAGNGAFLNIWKDGSQVAADTLPNAYNGGQESATATSNYQKLGIYHYYDTLWSAGDSRSIYHKGLIVYPSHSTLSEPILRAQIEGNPGFSATLAFAPASSATLTGIVNFQVVGADLENCELLGSSGFLPVYASFDINDAHTSAVLNWNTTSLSNGAIVVRIVAYDTPPGSAGTLSTVMVARTYFISNVSSSDMPITCNFEYQF